MIYTNPYEVVHIYIYAIYTIVMNLDEEVDSIFVGKVNTFFMYLMHNDIIGFHRPKMCCYEGYQVSVKIE